MDIGAYGLLATGAVDAGLELLDRYCANADTIGHRHWLSFRLPIYRSLFASEVHGAGCQALRRPVPLAATPRARGRNSPQPPPTPATRG